MDHTGAWDMTKIQEYFLPVDIIEIQKIQPSARTGIDFIAWAPKKSGLFLVRSAYLLAYDDLASSSIASASTHSRWMEGHLVVSSTTKSSLVCLESSHKLHI